MTTPLAETLIPHPPIGSADKSHFRHDHAGSGGLDPGRDRPVASAHIQTGSGRPAGLRIGRKNIIVHAVKRQSPSHLPGSLRRSDDRPCVLVARRIGRDAAARFVKSPVGNRNALWSGGQVSHWRAEEEKNAEEEVAKPPTDAGELCRF